MWNGFKLQVKLIFWVYNPMKRVILDHCSICNSQTNCHGLLGLEGFYFKHELHFRASNDSITGPWIWRVLFQMPCLSEGIVLGWQRTLCNFLEAKFTTFTITAPPFWPLRIPPRAPLDTHLHSLNVPDLKFLVHYLAVTLVCSVFEHSLLGKIHNCS
jgi:hypothetical protein